MSFEMCIFTYFLFIFMDINIYYYTFIMYYILLLVISMSLLILLANNIFTWICYDCEKVFKPSIKIKFEFSAVKVKKMPI